MTSRGVLVFVTTILIVTGAYVSTSELMSPSSASTSEVASSTSINTLTTSSLASYRILQRNLTIYFDPACIPPELEGFSCPTVNAAAHSPSLGNIELISYQGSEYYGTNFTGYMNGQPDTSDVWFTNSTILCVSPMAGGYPECPTNPGQPRTILIGDSSMSTLNSSTGIRLDLRISASASDAGGLNVELDVFNTLPSLNNVTAADNWPISQTALTDLGNSRAEGFAVYQGNYGVSNFTEGLPLNLHGLGFFFSTVPPPTFYYFSPNSDNSSVNEAYSRYWLGSRAVSISDSLQGYWTGNDTAPGSFNLFPPGLYTVVAMDQWGQASALQFTVKDG